MPSPEPLVGEPLAIDLVNTRPNMAAGPVDLLETPSALGAWLALEADRLPGFSCEEGAALSVRDLAPIHAVREDTAVALDHLRQGAPPPDATLRGLNQALRAAPALRELAWDGESMKAAFRREGPFALRLAARLAEAAMDLLCDPAAGEVRKCEAPDCVMLFAPGNPRRRWCSASRCGNRMRVARYYRRHKSDQEG